MFLFVIYFIHEYLGIRVPAVFEYYSTRMMLGSITTLIISIFIGPWFIRKLYELKIGQPIRKEDEGPLLAELHEKKSDTPTMGGVLILVAMLIAMMLWMDLTSSFTLILFLTTIYFGIIGGYDDYLKLKYKNARGLSSKKKFFFQIVFALVFSLYLLIPSVTSSIHCDDWFAPPVAKEHRVIEGQVENVSLTTKAYISRLYIPFMKKPVVYFSGASTILLVAFIVAVISGTSNGVNLTDGLDGLAAGCLLLVSLALAFFAFVSNHAYVAQYLNILYIEGSGEIAIYLCLLAGAILGFLWYNGPPAQVFMGDTGSLALGGIIGVSAVLLRREVLLSVIGGVFVVETLSVILQVASYKLRNKKRIFLCSPLHHHFEYKGWAETKVVVRFWIVGLLFVIIGLASLKFQ